MINFPRVYVFRQGNPNLSEIRFETGSSIIVYSAPCAVIKSRKKAEKMSLKLQSAGLISRV